MHHRFSFFLFIYLCSFFLGNVYAQCYAPFSPPLSARPTQYEIQLTLDDVQKNITAQQVLHFTNTSPVPISSLRFYMYFNAFKNSQTTFLKGATDVFGQPFNDRKKEEWGWIEVKNIQQGSEDISKGMRYIQLDDNNIHDQSVLEVPLNQPIMPGKTATFTLQWYAKIPKIIARAGYSENYFFMCHWFPQLGVFEQNRVGEWGWNCHQFFRQNEFYADFGTYNVTITAPEKYTIGASGCLVSEKKLGNGKVAHQYKVEDVIDFAWTAYPDCQVVTDKWKHVNIRLLTSQSHAYLAHRYISSVKFALEYLEKHVGKYPYASITVVDPPLYGLRSGLMEYPTLVTVGTIYGVPKGVRLMESLVVHEFAHQYFMQMLASNEKEEPWLDEGFVTYFEDRIIDAQFGYQKSLVDFWGYQLDNRERTRLEYTTMPNPRDGNPARPGWMFQNDNFKALIYSKSATTLRTLEQLIGTPKMDTLLQTYFAKWRFKHPRGEDFMAMLKAQMATDKDTVFAQNVVNLFTQSIYGNYVLDYAVKEIKNETLPAPQGLYGAISNLFTYQDGKSTPQKRATVSLSRLGDWVFPVELKVVFKDGTTKICHWDGKEGQKEFVFFDTAEIVSAQIDPQNKISLDINQINNSKTLEGQTQVGWKWGSKSMFWLQNIFQALSFLS